MATENLQIPDIAASQNQKEVTANAAHNLLDRAMNKSAQKTITGDTSLTATEARENVLIELTGTPGAAFTLDMPDTNKRVLAILNNTGQTATIRNSAGAGADQPVIANGDQSFFHYDGVDFTALGGGGAATFLELTDTPASYSGEANKAAHVNAGATAIEFRDIAAAAVQNDPINVAARIKKTATQSITAATENLIIWAASDINDTFQPNDAGLTQRMWLGADFNFVDADVTVATDQIAETGHGFLTGEGPFRMTTTGTLPAGLALLTNYWAIRVDDNNFKVATSRANAIAGTAVDITAAAGGGTHTIDRANRLVVPANVTKVRVIANLNTTTPGSSNQLLAWIAKNAVTALPGIAFSGIDATAGDDGSLVHTGVLEVVEGDFFEVLMQPQATGNVQSTAPTFFVIEIVENTASTKPHYDIDANFAGAPGASVVTLRFIAPRNYRLPSGLTNSQGFAAVAATASTAFDIQKNGSSVGTMTFAASATVATFVMASDTDFTAGDRVEIVAPGTPDASLADIAVTLAGIRIS